MRQSTEAPLCLIYRNPAVPTATDLFHILKIKSGIEKKPKLIPELIRLLPHTAVKIDEVSVEIVEDLKIISGRLVEQYPSGSAEHFNISLVFQGKAGEDFVPQSFLSAHPCHKAVDEITSFAEAFACRKPAESKKRPFSMYGFPYTQNDLFV